MKNRIITLENLVEFCRTNKIFSYNATETGHPLVVSTFGEVEEFASNVDEGLIPIKIKSCHIGLNRNGSYISEESMTKAIPSFANKPFLAEITNNSKGEIDFGTHAMELTEDEEGNSKIYYIEKPIGIVPESNNAQLIYDEDQDKTYLWVDAYVFKYYGNEAEEILERKGGTKVSIEISINEMAWDAKNNWLDIQDFVFDGVTGLGEDYGEGMLGSKCVMSDFSHYTSNDYTKEINEMKSRLERLESSFSNKNFKEGGNHKLSKLDELLAQYGKTIEDIDFDYEGLSDEELEAKFAEVFGEPEDNSDVNSNDNNDDNDENGQPKTEPDSTDNGFDENTNTDDNDDPQGISNAQKTEDDEGGSVKKPNNDFALSLQEKIQAVSNLVSATYEEADNEWYYSLVYDDFVVMVGYFQGRAYKQNYKVENDEYSLVGDRVEVFVQYLTQDEINELENMKKDYASLSQYKENIEKAQLDAAKNELLNDARFEMIKETEAYKTLVSNSSNYSLENLEKELKLIVADNVLGQENFATFSQQKTGKMFKIPSKEPNTVESKYGGIFTVKE